MRTVFHALCKKTVDGFGRSANVFFCGWKVPGSMMQSVQKRPPKEAKEEGRVPKWGLPYGDGIRDAILFPDKSMVQSNLDKMTEKQKRDTFTVEVEVTEL